MTITVIIIPVKEDMEMVSVIKDNCTVKDVQCTITITNSGYLFEISPLSGFFCPEHIYKNMKEIVL